ncbi:MAG: caspase family protein [Bacteroidetes bacterium]|nr:caspase family protein [Bacteroidota bacterium]
MKKKFLSALLFLTSLCAFSQKSNFVFFSENGEPFSLMLNGITYNSSPQSNVKAERLASGIYSAKITFSDPSLGNIIEQLSLDGGVEVTFMISLAKKTGVEKEVQKFGKGFFSTKPDSVVEKEKEKIDNTVGKYVLVFLSKTKISESESTSSNTANTSRTQTNADAMPEQGQYRGSGDPLKGLNVTKSKDMLIGNYYAVIIGIDKYKGKWLPLQNAVNDAKTIETTLKSKYKFDSFHTLYNEQATRKAIIAELEWLVKNVEEEDNVLIYYSGHGEYKKELNKGFWVPADALSSTTADYISNNDIQTYLSGIKSKHTLLVADACFSGDLFRGNTVSVPFENSEKYYKEVHGLASRQAFTSGGIEPVMDGGKNGHSVFAYYFLKSLSENESKYFDASQLYDKIKIPVVNNSEQTPKLSPLKDTGDEGGQFIFIKK